jgi:hypothetical protein
MDIKKESSQSKFLARKKKEGKKQRTFLLTDAAMDVIRKRQEETRAPNKNDTLEQMLISPPPATVPEEQTPQHIEQVEKQNAILEQAKRLADVYRVHRASQTKETRNTWGAESRKLALLIDPKRIVDKPPAKPEIMEKSPIIDFINRHLGSK